MQVTKLGELSMLDFYRKHKGKQYTSAKYPKCLFRIEYYNPSTHKIMCKLVKGKFTKTPVLVEEALIDRGVYFIETFEEGLENL